LYGVGGGFYRGEVCYVAGEGVDGAGVVGVARYVGLEVVDGLLEDFAAATEEVDSLSAILVEC